MLLEAVDVYIAKTVEIMPWKSSKVNCRTTAVKVYDDTLTQNDLE